MYNLVHRDLTNLIIDLEMVELCLGTKYLLDNTQGDCNYKIVYSSPDHERCIHIELVKFITIEGKKTKHCLSEMWAEKTMSPEEICDELGVNTNRWLGIDDSVPLGPPCVYDKMELIGQSTESYRFTGNFAELSHRQSEEFENATPLRRRRI